MYTVKIQFLNNKQTKILKNVLFLSYLIRIEEELHLL